MPTPNDSGLINLRQYYEVEYWTKKLDITPAQLTEIVDAVGNSIAAVRTHLGR